MPRATEAPPRAPAHTTVPRRRRPRADRRALKTRPPSEYALPVQPASCRCAAAVEALQNSGSTSAAGCCDVCMCRVLCQRQVGEQCVQRAVAASAHRADVVRAAAPVCQRQVGAWQRARFGKLGQCSVVQPSVSSCVSAKTVKVALQCSQLKTVQCYARIIQVFHALDGQWVRRLGSVSNCAFHGSLPGVAGGRGCCDTSREAGQLTDDSSSID